MDLRFLPRKEGREMHKLFDALREQHPGYDVVDFRLLANQQEVNGRSAKELDDEFAEAVRSAMPIDIASIT